MKIGWQKYEDLIKNQLTNKIGNLFATMDLSDELDLLEKDQESISFEDFGQETEGTHLIAVPVSDNIRTQISLTSDYDCWIGHTDFDITKTVAQQIETCQGVEVLNILTRYRFLIGVGRLFEFTDTRQTIEEKLKASGNLYKK